MLVVLTAYDYLGLFCPSRAPSSIFQTPSTPGSHVQRPPSLDCKALGGPCPPLESLAQSLLQCLPRLGLDLFGAWCSINLDDPSLLPKILHDGHARLDEGAEPLADALFVVIGAPARLAPLQQPCLHGLLGAVVEQDELRGAHALLELECLVELARETVDEEALRGGQGILHGILEQGDGHLHGHDLAVLDIVFDELAVLGTLAVLLGAQQVACAEVRKAVAVDEARALGAFAGAGAAEDKDH